MINTGLRDAVTLITGAQHGIGAATAKAFAAQGATVFVHYFRPPHSRKGTETAHDNKNDLPGEALYRAGQAKPADEVVASIRSQGGQAEALEADLSRPEAIPALFDRAEKAFGPVQVLVNNAAHWENDGFLPLETEPSNPLIELWTSPSPTLTAGSHDRHFSVNSRAVGLMMAEYLRRYLDRNLRWGRIINVSTDGAHCFPGEVSYAASKAALEAYSRSAAWELGRFGITVNIVSPGPIQTGWITPELEKEVVGSIPLGRLGEPEDVADVILFLASQQARWLTGQLLQVGGGHRI